MKADEERRRQVAAQYRSRINLVLDYIEQNLAREFSLEELSAVAGFSKFHFHRVFYSMTGETLFQFTQRVRLEKGATILRNEPGKPVTDIALDCGFSGSSSFARSFKNHFGVSATDWRNGTARAVSKVKQAESNMGQPQSKECEDETIPSVYIEYAGNTQKWRFVMVNKVERHVDVKELEEMTLAYVRYVGPYKGDGQLFERLFGQLFRWAGPRGLVNYPETNTIIIYHDNPEITDEAKLRVSVCITVPPETGVDREIGKMTLPAGKYALARFELSDHEYQEAWNWLYGSWLPQSGYVPDDRPCFEMYHNDPKTHPQGKSIVDICIAVKPL